ELSGLTAIDGTGLLGPSSRGSAKYIIIPTREAAPDGPTKYAVGGSLRYIDHGSEVVLPLFPAIITVYPDPVLQLRYFHEREVFGDDPFTDEIEPAIPYNLGLIITNVGKGIAKNVRIASAQPKIVENEKGLLIDFQIIGTQVGDQALDPSLTAAFGNIEPSKSAVGRWLFVSSLQGKFIEYSATFEHVDAIGDKHISLIDSVEIHELIHVVRADAADDDTLPDFLVNDVEDEHHMPDWVYLSNGAALPVQTATEAAVDVQQAGNGLVATLTATMPEGWVYLRIPDPGQHLYKINRVVRSDDSEVLVDFNAWLTHRVRRPVGQPVYDEDFLHIFDLDSDGQYTVYYDVDWAATDHTPPTSSVGALAALTLSEQLQVQWSGQDAEPGSGLGFYDVYVSVDGGPFVLWLSRTTQTGAIFRGAQKHSYAFYCVATDAVGNREEAPATAQASTYIPDFTPPTVLVYLAQVSDSGVIGDGRTNIDTPTLAGYTEGLAHVTLDITGPSGYHVTGSTQASDSGAWMYTIDEPNAMPEGICTITASATDMEGNNSVQNAVFNLMIDQTPPVSNVTPFESGVPPLFIVYWSGQDPSGVMSYNVYASVDGGPFALWLQATPKAYGRYNGQIGHTYRFYCTARDNANNPEQKEPTAEAEAVTVNLLPIYGDSTMDCKIDILDLIFVRNRLNQSASSANNWQADVNDDGKINVLDLIAIRNRLNQRCLE
ncbi:MAG TPA: Ig-like domain-containing protein, partial [Planctomycetota bacterium]|nr:Ig-like domain-containing protein [Planctomycetota bacterium]